ncbi:MAG: glucose-1-phosphate adenylyltransferase, partial [Actinoallomurus sp.]
NYDWPILTANPPSPPAKFVFNADDRTGMALDSIVAHGAIISGGHAERSVISPLVRVNSWAEVTDSVLMDGVQVGRHAVVRRAILDKNVQVPEGVRIGVDREEDEARGFTVSNDGVVVLGKDQKVLPA